MQKTGVLNFSSCSALDHFVAGQVLIECNDKTLCYAIVIGF